MSDAVEPRTVDENTSIVTSLIARKPFHGKQPLSDAARRRAKSRLKDEHPGIDPRALTAIVQAKAPTPEPIDYEVEGRSWQSTDSAVVHFTDLYVHPALILPYQRNPREDEHRRFRWAALDGDPALTVEMTADPEGRAMLHMTVASPAHLRSLVKSTHNLMRREQKELHQQIRSLGVSKPITLVPVVIHHEDGTPDMVVLTSVDGSSRVSLAQITCGVTPDDLIYAFYKGKAVRTSHLAAVAEIAEMPVTDLDREQIYRYRLHIVPARVITDIHPYRTDEQPNALSVVRDLIEKEHVSPPKEWPEGGRRNHIAEKALEAAVAAGVLREVEARYMLGSCAVTDAEAAGLPVHDDERAHHITHKVVVQDTLRPFFSAAYRDFEQNKDRLGPNTRAELASEMILQPHRAAIGSNEIDGVRSTMERLWKAPLFRSVAPLLVIEPDDLLEAAIQDLEARPAEIGQSRLQLGLAGTFYLTVHRGLGRDNRQLKDNRGGAAVAQVLMLSKHGLRQLHEAVVKGRRGLPATIVLDDRGTLGKNGQGKEVPVTNEWLRKNFPDPEGDGDVPSAAPQALAHWWGEASRRVSAAREALDEVLALRNRVSPREQIHEARMQEHMVQALMRGLKDQVEEALKWATQLGVYETQYPVPVAAEVVGEETAVVPAKVVS